MSDDPDFPKADHALQVLRQARVSRNETAAIMVEDLVATQQEKWDVHAKALAGPPASRI
jgi:hypothetical protein